MKGLPRFLGQDAHLGEKLQKYCQGESWIPWWNGERSMRAFYTAAGECIPAHSCLQLGSSMLTSL